MGVLLASRLEFELEGCLPLPLLGCDLALALLEEKERERGGLCGGVKVELLRNTKPNRDESDCLQGDQLARKLL